MDDPYERQQMCWEAEYKKTSALWRGPPEELNIPQGARVLELGCGNGKTLSFFGSRRNEVVAVDYSHSALLSAQHATSKMDNITLIAADARSLPFIDSSFDIVLAFHLLEHLRSRDRVAAVAEMQRVLRPDGIVLAKLFSTADMRFGKGQEIEPSTYRRGTGIIYHYFTADEVRGLFQDLHLLSLEERIELKRFEGREHRRCELDVVARRLTP